MPDEEENDGAAGATAQADAPDDAAKAQDGDADQGDADQTNAEDDATSPEFQELEPTTNEAPGRFELNRFAGVQVVLTAELGRANVTLQELMALSEGSVVELDREIAAPVELVAQGVPLGNGEVVVVEDRFAIRIIQIYQTSQNAS